MRHPVAAGDRARRSRSIALLAARDPARCLVFCDEDAEVDDPVAALAGRAAASPLAVLIGPEGGFAEDERAALLRLPNVVRLSLGPRILRADTAAVAALALVQAVLGDWRSGARTAQWIIARVGRCRRSRYSRRRCGARW